MTGTSDEVLYRAFVGPRSQGYYLSYFARADARGYAPISWHWPVLAVGLLWLVYRKLYLWAVITFAFPYLASALGALAERMIPGTGEPLAWTLVIGFFAAWLPLQANALYYRQARAAIEAVRIAHPGRPEDQAAVLALSGGVHRHLPMIMFALLVLLIALSGSIGQLRG